MSSSDHNQARIKKSRGRQKVSMVKMANRSNLQVTFSKRRAGLFKKASELCTLCGSQAAIVVFSPAEKVYCFGHPNVQTVLDKFSANDPNPNDGIISTNTTTTTTNNNNNPNRARNELIMEAHRNSTIRELNLELTQLEGMLRAQRRRAEELEMIKKVGLMQKWYPGPLDEFNFDQLCALRESILEFKKKMDEKVQKHMLMVNAAYNNNNQLLPPNYFTNSSHHANFQLGFGSDVSRFPTFNHPMGGNDFSGNYGFGHASDINPMISTNNHGGFSSTTSDPVANIGSGSFGLSGGYNMGYEYPN